MAKVNIKAAKGEPTLRTGSQTMTIPQWICYLNSKPGIPGPQGPKGDTGATGQTGPMGPAGPEGKEGPAGPQGPIGLPGPQGIQGAQGIQGPQGLTGPAGPDGSKGDPGPIGPQGAQGNVGPIGPAGSQGVQGEPGPTGTQGTPGANGTPGATGPQGVAGPQGPQGNVGPQGPQGAPGVGAEEANVFCYTVNNTTVPSNGIMPLKVVNINGVDGSKYFIQQGNFIYFKLPGRYFVTYNILSETSQCYAGLVTQSGAYWNGSVNGNSSGIANPISSASGTVILNIYPGLEMTSNGGCVGVKNFGTNSLLIPNIAASLSILPLTPVP